MDGHAPRIAAIIPAWRQPALLAEAIISVLRQEAAARAAAIIVDDGCDFPETRETALSFARAHPGRVHYFRRRNGGLSAARNTGIAFALAAWPELEAVMFLDADNRIQPGLLARALDALAAAPPETGWIYPDIDMLGLAENWSMRGPFSLLVLLRTNFCDAGSVVRADLLRRGFRFDESLRDGFEDWDFWLQAAEAGFVGQHLPRAGFQYRRRGESMSIAANRRRDVILAQMNRKRRALLRPPSLLAIEAREAPRFAILSQPGLGARLTSLPIEAGERLAAEALAARIQDARRQPAVVHVPPFLCFVSEAVLAALESALVLPALFWLLQRRLRHAQGFALFLRAGKGPELRLEPGAAAGLEAAALIALPACDPAWGTEPALAGRAAAPALPAGWNAVTLTLPPPAGPLDTVALALARGFLQLFLAPREAPLPADWRADGRLPRHDLLAIYDAVAGLGPPLPISRRPGERREVGFLVPLHSFGGVEKVIANQARVLRAAGYRPHLFVSGGDSITLTPETRTAFQSATLMDCPDFDACVDRYEYFGTAMSGFERLNPPDARQDVIGLLGMMDVVINTHSLGGHGIAAQLRSLGVTMMMGLHLVERSPLGAPEGNAHMALAYEQAYDHILVISRALWEWARGFGIPEQKLVLLPNAPSYPDRDPEAAICRRRAARPPGPLRVLFLGRLDWQKGVDRLNAIIRATRRRGVEWRVIGRRVVMEAGPHADETGLPIEPPLHDPAALDAAYDWADVLVLPSRFEGVPLTLLEARRRGCIVIATRVGAVAEAVTEGEGAWLIEPTEGEAAIISGFVARLLELAADPALRAHQAELAARAPRARWEESMAPLLALLPPIGAAKG